MKFSKQWLQEWVNPPLSTAEIANQLTMAGLEVDAIEPVAASFAGVVVGEVVSIDPHPHREDLCICQVHVGDIEPLTVVCGAPNVRVGLRAPLAMAGAVFPDGRCIQQTYKHGIKSQGMLCSASELGLSEDATGLLELPPDTRPGEDVYLYLKLDDISIELSVTPNRGDCLSIAGVARELAVLNHCAIHTPPLGPVPATIPDTLEVRIEAPVDCPRYVGRVLRGISRDAATPLWMQERLRRSGVRSISPVVDVTNYVMLELGQPMHAFDLAKLAGGIRIRHAFPGEAITLLDGQTVTLGANTLVIADQQQAQAIAGVMGGATAAVGEDTDSLFLESAFFAPRPFSGHARAYGLATESSYRFERGVDPTLQARAMERATAMLLDIVGGEVGPLIEVSAAAHLPVPVSITLRPERLRRLLGITLPGTEIAEILAHLGMAPVKQGEGWEITPPAYRFDIGIEADVIEEVARIHGYDRLPISVPEAHLTLHPRSEAKIELSQLRQILVDRGYQEIVTYSFVDPVLQAYLDPDHPPIALANPISGEMSVMRTSLWCGLVQAVVYNQSRQQTRLRFFESGLNFTRQGEEIRQEKCLASIVTGDVYPQQWGVTSHPVDFYDLKGDVEALLAMTGAEKRFSFTPGRHPALHPGRSARISCDGEPVGWLGALHPRTVRESGLSGPVYVFELRLATLEQGGVPHFRELSKFPAIRRDIAIVVDEAVPAAAVGTCIADIAIDFVQDLQLFDVYRGEATGPGKKSLALGLTLQAASRTLTDQEVDAFMERIIGKLYKELGATLRK